MPAAAHIARRKMPFAACDTGPAVGPGGSGVRSRTVSPSRGALLCATALALVACRKSSASPHVVPAPAAPPAAARFCDQDLSGLWLNASDAHYAYRLRDHGDVIRGEYLEHEDDGGLQNPDEPITFELHRTAGALAGVMRSTGSTPSGRTCPVEFGVKVTSCRPAAIMAVVENSFHLTEDCKRLVLEDGGEEQPDLAEYQFVRADGGVPGAPDGAQGPPAHPSGGGEGPPAH